MHTPQATGHWQLRLLGGLEARNGELHITRFVSRPTALLLVRLALWPQRMHAREELVDLLWPDAPLDAGRNRLRQALAALKRMLEPPGSDAPPVILADRQSLRINTAALSCDVQAFETALREGRFDAARALYQGELLPGFYDEWVHEERGRLAALAERLAAAPALPAPSAPSAPVAAPPIATLPPVETAEPPSYLTRLFGRDAELAQLPGLLREHRLVTLCGPGGCGKTRLATELLQRLRAAPDGGGFDLLAFVPLAECSDADALRSQLRVSLQLPPPQREAADPLATALAGRRVLLVLDNAEQLVSAPVLELIEGWLGRLPGLHLLVTSRRVLGLPGEREKVLPPLPLPREGSDAAALRANPGIALFIDRARALRPDFQVPERQLAALLALCRALDGLPLAIELAAARSRAFSIAEMHAALTRPFELLQRTGAAARGRRHDSLQAAIDWSWRLLDPAQQALLAALAVFRGGWTADDAQAVCPVDDARARLEALVADSLLTVEAPPDEDADEGAADKPPALRFQMLEGIRAFVLERLPEEQRPALRAAHRAHFAARTEALRAADRVLDDADLPNIAEALRSAVDDGVPGEALALALALSTHWNSQGIAPELLALLDRAFDALPLDAEPAAPAAEGAAPAALMLAMLHLTAGHGQQARGRAAQALQAAGSRPALRGQALCARVRIAFELDRQGSGLEAALDEAAALAQRAGAPALSAEVIGLRGMLLLRHGDDPLRADQLLLEATARHRALGQGREARRLQFERACCLVRQRRWHEALIEAQVCEAAYRDAGDRHQRLSAINLQGVLHAELRQWPDALRAYRRCAQAAWALHNHYWLAYALWNHGRNLARLRRPETAALLMAFSQRFWATHFGTIDRDDLRYVRRVRRLAECQLGRAATAIAWQRGEALTLPQAIGLALAESEPFAGQTP
ncbi:NACHT domain-containing protein [Aquincola sp. S2]|uniref:NACHT domain-containing protein n=1 Tax=Pseudaquabacterium terrae TaxID=2732868 RepID=A0ABX2EID7_9BURK|nr:NACHT domain-containing protein [Aquabacterium terrae]NRF68378.1 NACHT domain-containing protein [Aquabacterium terrae]